MPNITLSVFEQRNVPLVRFSHHGRVDEINAHAALIDSRGYNATSTADGRTSADETHGSVIAIVPNSAQSIDLTRVYLDNSAPLTLRVTGGVARVTSPTDGHTLTGRATHTVTLNAGNVPAGSDMSASTLEVLCDGFVIHRATIWVFKPITLRIVEWMVDLNGPGTGPSTPDLDLTNVNTYIQDIFAPAGIRFRIEQRPTQLTVSQRGRLRMDAPPLSRTSSPAEYERWRHPGPEYLESRNLVAPPQWARDAINIYFVRQFADPTGGATMLGIGYDRGFAALQGTFAYGPNRTGILIPRLTLSGAPSFLYDVQFAATIAHEIGHMLDLEHMYVPVPQENAPAFSKATLMHGLFDNHSTRAGASVLLPLKRLPQSFRPPAFPAPGVSTPTGRFNDNGVIEARLSASAQGWIVGS